MSPPTSLPGAVSVDTQPGTFAPCPLWESSPDKRTRPPSAPRGSALPWTPLLASPVATRATVSTVFRSAPTLPRAKAVLATSQRKTWQLGSCAEAGSLCCPRLATSSAGTGPRPRARPRWRHTAGLPESHQCRRAGAGATSPHRPRPLFRQLPRSAPQPCARDEGGSPSDRRPRLPSALVSVPRSSTLTTRHWGGPGTNISKDTVFAFNGRKVFKLRTQLSHYTSQFAEKSKAPHAETAERSTPT